MVTRPRMGAAVSRHQQVGPEIHGDRRQWQLLSHAQDFKWLVFLGQYSFLFWWLVSPGNKHSLYYRQITLAADKLMSVRLSTSESKCWTQLSKTTNFIPSSLAYTMWRANQAGAVSVPAGDINQEPSLCEQNLRPVFNHSENSISSCTDTATGRGPQKANVNGSRKREISSSLAVSQQDF